MYSDLRFALRSIRGMPVVAGVVIVSLGIGIGVNTAVFSWVQAVVLRPLPGVSNVSSLYLVEPRTDTGSYPGASWREYLDLQERVRALPDLAAFRMAPLNTGDPGRTERAWGLLVSGNYFSALGLQAAAGRLITAADARPGGEPVVVVSAGFWRTRLGSDPNVIGRTLRVNDRILTIVGVTPERFQGTVLGLNFDLWVPATLAPTLIGGSRELDDRSQRGYSVFGRLPRSFSAAAVRRDLDEAMRVLARDYPETNGTIHAELLPFWQAPRGPQRLLAGALWILQTIVLLLLVAVCANTANLMLARVSGRTREIGMRLALGATRWQILRLVFAEHLLLAVAGAVLGIAIALWGTNALRAVPIITAFPIRFQTDLDAVTMAFGGILGAASGVFVGAAPAVRLARLQPHAAMQASPKRERRGLRSSLMTAEVAIAMLVLMAAGLFMRTFAEARETDPGFRVAGVLLAAYDETGRNLDATASREFTRRLLDRLQALPAVEAAAIAASVPLDVHGLPMRTFAVEGHATSQSSPDQALSNVVTPGYFRAMGIPFRAGSDFAALGDTTAPPQVIVNEEFVRRFVAGGEPLGRALTARGSRYVIAGVVANSVSESFGEPPTPVIYFSYRDRPAARGEIHVRTRSGSETLAAPSVERVVREIDATLPVYDVRTLAEHVDRNLFLRRIPARMFVVLGPLLLVLAAIGIYAVVAYSVSRRTVEIGVRIALGATASRVTREIVAESFRAILAGALLGWAAALAVDLHLVRGIIYASVFAGVPTVLLTVGALACWLPARGAANIDPLIAMRQE